MPAAQYEVISLSVANLNRITLPKFQRGLVWNSRKKREFITTLREGLPFGAILVYPKSNDPDSDLLILDGQQRLSTIIEYQNDPLKFWKPLNSEMYTEAKQAIQKHLDDETIFGDREFDALLRAQGEDLGDWIEDNAKDSRDDRKAVRKMANDIKREMKSYIDLDNLRIPAIKFIGKAERIAEVFANLNKGGVPLSKYEIYSSAWVHTKISLLSADQSPLEGEILGYVKKYYAEMSSDAEFELDGFSEDELTLNPVITLSELGIAIGMYTCDHLKSLIPKGKSASAELGYGILGIACGIDNRKLDALISSVETIDRNLWLILEKVDRICTNLDEIFSKLLKCFHASKNDEFANGLSTTFKTLSYFAALWDLEPQSSEYRRSLANIKAHYVFDALTGVWSSHGDQRLLDYYSGSRKRDYLTSVNQDNFKQAFHQWIQDLTPGIMFSKEIKALTTIHANLTYLSQTVPYGEGFELEHIIAKKYINAADDHTSRKIYGGSLGNCMYLPRLDNNKKKTKTLYEVNDNGKYDELITGALYPDREALQAAIDALIEGPVSAPSFPQVNELIEARSYAVGDAIVISLLK